MTADRFPQAGDAVLASSAIPVEVRRLVPHAVLPAYQTDAAAGADLSAALEASMVLAPGDRALVPTGLAIALPFGTEGQVRPRSGLAAKHGVTVLNSPGTIDADYRGEVRVLVVNLGREPYVIEPGARIAQLVVARCERAAFGWAEDLGETSRGDGGFGSTGR